MPSLNNEILDFIHSKNIIIVKQPGSILGIQTDKLEKLLAKVEFPFIISSDLPIQVPIPQDRYFELVLLAQTTAKQFTPDPSTFTALVFTKQDIQLIDFVVTIQDSYFVLNITYKHEVSQQTLSNMVAECFKATRNKEPSFKPKQQTPYDAFQNLGQHLLKEDVGSRRATVTCITRLLEGKCANDTDIPPVTYLQQLVATGVTRVAIGVPDDDFINRGQVYIYDSNSEEFQEILNGFQNNDFHELDIHTMTCSGCWA